MTKTSVTTAAAMPPQEQRAASFSKRIGSTTFLVSVHFSETSKETAGDKIARLVRAGALPNQRFGGERTSDGAGELSRPGRSERGEVREDDAERKAANL